MASKLYRDRALVLRTHKLGEADRIITLLTAQHGTVRAVAKGVRKTASRFGARLEPLCLIDVQLHRGRNLDTISQVETIESYAEPIISDFDRYACASAMFEVTAALTDMYMVMPGQSGDTGAHFSLLIRAVRALASQNLAPELILDSYLLRSLALAGWAPSLDKCAVCGAAGPHYRFSAALGGLLCGTCTTAGALPVRGGVRDLLQALAQGNWGEAVKSDAATRTSSSRIIRGAVQWQLEKPIKSFDLIYQP